MTFPLTTRLLSRCYYGRHVFVQKCNHRTLSSLILSPRKDYCSTRSSTNTTVQTFDSTAIDLGQQSDVNVKDKQPARVKERPASTPPPLYMDTYEIVQNLSKAGIYIQHVLCGFPYCYVDNDLFVLSLDTVLFYSMFKIDIKAPQIV